ncbi:MAG: hypothetical protein M5U09_25080, partial [Gammaproteobacteria bacterium]|nr:hypothetical protein [Gammaproteobacteria bacterium]
MVHAGMIFLLRCEPCRFKSRQAMHARCRVTVRQSGALSAVHRLRLLFVAAYETACIHTFCRLIRGQYIVLICRAGGCAEERECGDHPGMRHETVPGYRYGLNRFVPAAFTGDVLLIPSRDREGKFEIVEDGKRFTSPAIPGHRAHGETPSRRRKDCRGIAPTVVFEPEYPDSESRRESKPLAASDHRYIQQAARRRLTLPV